MKLENKGTEIESRQIQSKQLQSNEYEVSILAVKQEVMKYKVNIEYGCEVSQYKQ